MMLNERNVMDFFIQTLLLTFLLELNLRDLMSDPEPNSKEQRVQIVAGAPGITNLKIHFRGGVRPEPCGKTLVVRESRGANGFTTGFENTLLAGLWTACCGRRCGLV